MNNKMTTAMEYLTLIIGAVIAAFAIEEFLVPNTILDGGIVGVSIIVNNLSKIPLSILTIVFNIPFLIIGARKMGAHFIVKAAVSMVVFAVALIAFAPFEDATDDPLLAVCFGGVILGIGVGLVLRAGGCLDGTETVALMLNRKYGISVGKVVLTLNVLIYSAAGFLFGLDRAMYSLLTYIITSKILDMVENGFNQAKAAMIITDDATEISDKIFKILGRTVTIMEGAGLVSGEKKVLYCVISNFEIWELKHIISSVDSSAFVTISDVSEIIGEHMKVVKKQEL